MKFLDERCTGRPTKIFHIRTSGDLPKGQTCFMDEGGYGTYLDGKMMSPPLSYLNVVATDTSAPRVYEVNYTFANDVVLRADCGSTQGPSGEFCSIKLSDDGLLDTERAIQRGFEDEQKLKNGPPAPKL